MTALAAELDLFAFSLAVFAAVFSPLAVLVDGAAAGRMRTLVCVCHRHPLCRRLRLDSADDKEETNWSVAQQRAPGAIGGTRFDLGQPPRPLFYTLPG